MTKSSAKRTNEDALAHERVVEKVEVEVGEDRRDRRSLRKPAPVRLGVQPARDKPEHARIDDVETQPLEQLFMRHIFEGNGHRLPIVVMSRIQ